MTMLSVALAVAGVVVIGVLVVMSTRKLPTMASAVKPHQETHNRQRVIASLARIVPSSQRVRFDPAAFADLSSFIKAVLELAAPDTARFVPAHSNDGQQQSHSVTFEKHTFRATVPAQVELSSVEPLLGIVNGALNASHSSRRVAMLFDQQHHWFAVLEPGYAARLQRVGVVVEPTTPQR
ncbi:MAG: hypothetical protein Q8N23_24755 [Archangium sp.]|nr:hypothetical protein [Archangium sp.]MDP3155906.1 hypothetical protein [Archangium sp.]MDP3574418.1 hypothetical protein [Archangium sp.]